MDNLEHEEVLQVFLEVFGTVISFKAECIEFTGYRYFLVNFGERASS